MVGKTNVAGARLRAVIAVTYPEGSICTCSNGTKTLTARDTSGKALFNVPTGEWTVSCTDGSRTKSVTVSITQEGQCESVELMYRLYLYNAGDQCTDITGGWFASTYDGQGVSFNTDHIYLAGSQGSYYATATTRNIISRGNYTKLCFDGSVSKLYKSFGAASTNGTTEPNLVYVTPSQTNVREVVSCDITGLTTFYPGCFAAGNKQYVYAVWLE